MYCLASAACKQNSAVASAAAASEGSTAKVSTAARAFPTVVLENTRSFFVRPSSLRVDGNRCRSLVLLLVFPHPPPQLTPLCWIFSGIQAPGRYLLGQIINTSMQCCVNRSF